MTLAEGWMEGVPRSRWPRRWLARMRHWLSHLKDPEHEAKLEFFQRIFLFEDISRRHMGILLSKMTEKTYPAGDVIFQEGDLGRACFLVAEGHVEITQKSPQNGSPVSLAVLSAGDFLGEMVLLDELPRSGTAKTLSPSRLFILYKTHFDALMEESPRVALAVMHALARLLSARLRYRNSTSDGSPRGPTSLP